MTRALTILAALALAALAGGCRSACADGCGCGGAGADSDADADTDADSDADTDSDSDTDTGTDGDCPDPIAASCPDAVAPYPLLFEAADLGAGTAFVDVAPWSVLAEGESGGTRTITIASCRGADGWGIDPCDAATAITASIEVDAATGPRAIALAAAAYGGGPDLPPYLAVLCGDAGCALYGADLDAETPDTELAAIPGGELPSAAAVHGLWRAAEGDLHCAYGDGIHCFDGAAWSSPVAANDEDPLLNAMTSVYVDGAPGAVAVGDKGRRAISGFPIWESWWGEAYPDWHAVLAVDASSGGYVVAGAGGAADFGNGVCPWTDEDIVALLDLGESGMEWSAPATGGVTRSGRVFLDDESETGMAGACYTGQDVGDDPRAVSFRCGIEANVLLMDAAALYGTTDCAID